MNLTQAILEIRTGMSGRTTIESQIIRALNSAQRSLEDGLSLPDYLLEFDAEITVTGGSEEITLPADLLRLHDEYEMYYIDPTEGRTSVPLRNESEARSAYGDVEDSTHAIVWVRRSRTSGILVPTPTASDTYYLTYYKAEPILTTSQTTNKWLDNVPDVMIGVAGKSLATVAGFKEGIAYFNDYLQRGERIRMGRIIEEELQGRPIIMGRNN